MAVTSFKNNAAGQNHVYINIYCFHIKINVFHNSNNISTIYIYLRHCRFFAFLAKCLSKVYSTRNSVFLLCSTVMLNVAKFVKTGKTESLNLLTNKMSQLHIKKTKEVDATFVCIS